MNKLQSLAKFMFVFVLTAGMLIASTAREALAAYTPQAQVSITFDDGFLSTYTNALPILSARNIPATIYPNTTSMDTGKQADGFPALSWAQLLSLQNDYGWEVGGHSNTHAELPKLTQAQIASEIATSNAELASHGLNVTNFATPFGAYDNKTLVEALKAYESHRGFQDRDTLDSFPYNKGVLTVQSLEGNVSPTTVKGWIDQAIANKQWLIIVAHDVQPTYNTQYEYTVTTADLTTIADYIKSTGIKTVTVEQGLQKPGATVNSNGNFANGITDWTTDSAQVALDTNNNGAYSNVQNSVKLAGSAAAGHLFSTLIDAVPGANYLFEAFYNTIGLTAGELGFYIDEYDANGNWISGQWLGMVANNAVGYFDKLYTTTSSLVSKLRLQTYLTANANGNAYVDNVDLHNLDLTGTPAVTPTATPTPTVTPTGTPSATPTPTTATNLIQNPTFDNGLTNGWTTDKATQVALDTNNNGGAPTGQNSIKMTGGTASAHLFFGLLPIDPSTNYVLQAFVNATNLTSGELGFYMDEYDTTGNWISGQWLGMVANGVSSTFNRVYKATSTLVSQVRVQTYIFQGSNGSAYVDNYSLTNQNAPTPTVTVTPTTTPTATPSVTLTPTETPSVTPSVTPTVTVTPTTTPSVTPTPTGTPAANLVLNPSFEELLSNWATNWEKDTTDFVIDLGTNGNNGANSLHIAANTNYAHAFSAKITVDPTKTYAWKQYVTTLSGTGEFGFYIDEYDANGNWVSGQWKGMITGAFTGSKDFTYTPTSVNVKTIRLQYYTVPNSTFNLFLDSVSLSSN
jgi:peptidoglycan/xylan/chitin deacetylase (PgdA/CDA1 family)